MALDIDDDEFAELIAAAVSTAVAPLYKRIGVLEEASTADKQRIAALEARPETHDAGVWKAGVVYKPGALVSHDGSGWICSAHHHAVGTAPDYKAFRLFVKHGRDLR